MLQKPWPEWAVMMIVFGFLFSANLLPLNQVTQFLVIPLMIAQGVMGLYALSYVGNFIVNGSIWEFGDPAHEFVAQTITFFLYLLTGMAIGFLLRKVKNRRRSSVEK